MVEHENPAPNLDEKIFNPFANLDQGNLSYTHQKFEEVRTNCKYYTISCLTDNFSSNNDLKILHINARSLLSDEKFDEFKVMLYRSGVAWDIICVSETWLYQHMEQYRFIDGYTSFMIVETIKVEVELLYMS